MARLHRFLHPLRLHRSDFPFREKGKIGYGVGYHKEGNTLYFNGIVNYDIINKTIVVQITNLQQKILKELWVFGNTTAAGNNEREESEKKKKQDKKRGEKERR